ncbi:unnamed protein product [Aureobasidium vineae]|uniref:Uncharacterized protein n=1 Tax=Aureobasidium vineae TaxID=2773715 RepID=A0A9N8JU17_9PEZI|nr:unnamed protein product [Aureobasidium vineae]
MFGRSFVCCLLPLSATLGDAAAALHPFRHEAIEVRRRQADASNDALLQSSTAGSVLTYITPSPGASPIPVTQQSQLVSSNMPIFTLCALPPEAFFPATVTPTQTTAPYRNYSISITPGPGTCTTIYSPTVTMVCATTLTGIDRMYPVTACGQDITFSSDFGYVLKTPSPTLSNATDAKNTAVLITPTPTVQPLTTYYVAPWTELTSAGPPTDVDKKICATYPNGTEECVVEYYVWKTSLVTIPMSTVTSINLTTTVAGPSQIIVETFVANVTEMLTTFSMSTTMELTYSVETETTNIATRPTVSTGPTVTQTYTLSQNPLPTITTTSTSTRRVTRTIYISGRTMTTTVSGVHVTTNPTAESQSSAVASPSLDVASILGIGT